MNNSRPTVAGTATVGQQLTASPGSWTGSPTPTYTYAWQRCDSTGANCAPISGAGSATYTVASADAGNTLEVAVTASNTAGSVTATSTPIAVGSAAGVGPTTPVLDSFNRANGPAGSNWSLIKAGTAFAAMNVSGNTATDASATAYAWNYWNPASFGPDTEAYATVASYGSDTIRIGARVTLGTGYSGYFVSITSTGAWSIIRFDNGGSPVTLATGPTQTLASGDKIAIRIVGSQITALHYTTATGWTQVLSYDTSHDATRYTTAGSLALEFKTSTIDDFGGGTLP